MGENVELVPANGLQHALGDGGGIELDLNLSRDVLPANLASPFLPGI